MDSDIDLGYSLSIKLEHRFIDIAPAPILIWLKRLNNRMSGFMEMGRCMPILRTIATANMTTGQTDAQMNPSVA